MASRQHRLFTRLFNQRIDIGVVFAVILFIAIWFFLPSAPTRSEERSAQTVHFQATRKSLDDVPPYRRPDLALVPSSYSFSPSRPLTDDMMDIPLYAYSTDLDLRLSRPAGMGALATLGAGIGHGDHRVLLVASPVSGVLQHRDVERTGSQLDVRMSTGLENTKLRTDHTLWQSELAGDSPWQFAFWVSFLPQEPYMAEGPQVFVEERSGSIERDLRLLRIVERMEVWENPTGEGMVWLHFEPETGDIDED